MALLFAPYLRAADQSNVPISGAFLSFYQTQTSTPQPIWADVNLTIPLQNPLPSDSNGVWPVIWLDDSLPPYKVVQQYPAVTDSTIPGAIVAGPNGTIDPYNSIISALAFNQLINPLRQVEIDADITVVDFSWQPMDVDRYVNNAISGVTDTVAGFNAATRVAKVVGGTVRWGATAPYRVGGPINNTESVANGYAITFLNEAGPDLARGIIADHTGHVFDCTGSLLTVFEKVSITSGTASPKTGIFQARNSTNGSVGITRFNNCVIIGSFSVANYYNYGAEDDQLDGCYMENTYSAGPSAVVLWTANNIKAQTSSFQTVSTSPPAQSCIDHKVIGGEYFNNSSNAAADVFYLEQADHVKISLPWMACFAATGGRSFVYVDMTNAPSNFCAFFGLQGEDPGSAARTLNGILFSNHAQTCVDWIINGMYVPVTTRIISAPALATCFGFHLSDINEPGSTGLSFAGTLQGSTLDLGLVSLIIGTSANNVLIGDTSRWTITTRTHDNWIDIGSANKTWTPAAGTLAHGGVLTFSEANWLYGGSKADFELIMSDTVGITASVGQTITGLLTTAAGRSASISIFNTATGTFIGGGFVNSGTQSITIGTAFTVGANVPICISGSYFIA